MERNQTPYESNKIFVGGLDPHTTESQLLDVFSSYGYIIRINMPLTNDRLRNKGFCIITFKDEDSVSSALNDPPHSIGGCNIIVNRAMKQRSAMMVNQLKQKTKLYAYGFPFDVFEEEISEAFTEFGVVEKVSMQHKYRNGQKIFKGFAFIFMRDVEGFERAMRCGSFQMGQNTIKIQKAIPKSQPKPSGPNPKFSLSLYRPHGSQIGTEMNANICICKVDTKKYDENIVHKAIEEIDRTGASPRHTIVLSKNYFIAK